MAGKRRKLFYDSASDHDNPTWVEIGRARDIKMPRSKGKADGSRRESGFEIAESALKTIGLEFGYVYKVGDDDVFEMLLDSYENDTRVQFAVTDGAIDAAGTRLVKFWGEVFDFDIDAPLKGDDLIPVKVEYVGEDTEGTAHEPVSETVEAST